MLKSISTFSIIPALIVALFCISGLNAQNPVKWANYSKDFIIGDIDRDSNLIWISTYGGLVKFDKNSGNSHVLTGANSGITNSNINNTFVASNGDKWISTANGGLIKYDDINWTTYRILPTGDTIHQLFELDEDPNGNIWFSSYPNGLVGGLQGGTELYKYDGSNFDKITIPVQGLITDLACDSLGNLWVINNNKLNRFNGLLWTPYDSTNSNIPGIPTNIEIDHAGNLWVTVNGTGAKYLSKFDGSSFLNTLVPFSIGNSLNLSIDQNNTVLVYGATGMVIYDGTVFTPINNLPHNSIGAALIDNSGKIFVGFWVAEENVFYELDISSNIWKSYFTSNAYLRSPYGRDVAFDNDYNRWMVTNSGNGIVKFDGSTWTSYTTLNSGLPNNKVTRVFFDSNGNMWTGHDSNGGTTAPLARFDGVNWQHFSLNGLYPTGNGWVFDIKEDLTGNIWVGTSQGIARYGAGIWSYFTTPTLPAPGNIVDEIKIDLNNHVYGVSNQFGLLKYDGLQWTFINSTNSGMANNYVLSFDFDNNNHLWVSLPNSIIQKYDGSTWTTYPLALNGITYGGAFDVAANPIDNSIWISTPFEVVKFDGTSWTRFDVFNSGICSGVGKTRFDKYNNKWMVTINTGFVVYNENGLNYENVFNIPNKKITGKVYYDADGNGLFNAGTDHGVSSRRVRLLPDSTLTYTNNYGDFSFNRNPGFYEVEYLVDSNWVITSDSLIYQVQLNSTDADSLDFGTYFSGFENTGVISCVGMNDRCNIPSPHLITYRNEGTTVLNGSVKYVLDSTFSFISAVPSPDSINGDTLSWNYVNLLQFEERQIFVLVQNPSFQQIGQIFLSHATLYSNQQSISSDTTIQQIRCSYDPNDKLVHPQGGGNNNEILEGTSLTYTIRFQNTGNDTAFFVLLIDTLSSYLDISTFEFQSSSHNVVVDCSPSGVVRFIFNDINLLWSSINEPASNGFVKFRINHKANLTPPFVIENKAHIYFDFNPAIITNIVSNTIVNSLTGSENDKSLNDLWKIYPNPSGGNLKIEFAHMVTGSEMALYDSNGRLCLTKKQDANTVDLDIKELNDGLYFLRCFLPNGSVLTKKMLLHKQ